MANKFTFNPLSGNFDLVLNTDSPAFTGTPTAPTATQGNNSTQIATTAYVDAAILLGKEAEISALDIDWNLAFSYYKSISTGSTFTFSNVQNGKTITVVLTNSSGTDVSVVFPTLKKTLDFNTTVKAGMSNVYTFIASSGNVYASYIPDMA